MFDLIAITALAVSGICAIGSSLWALSVYKGKRDKQDAGQFRELKRTEPVKFELDIMSFGALHVGSLAPKEVRDQAIAVAKVWPQIQIMPETSGQEWQKAIAESIALADLRKAQRTLDLKVAHVDYMQLINRNRPQDIEDLFRGARRISYT